MKIPRILICAPSSGSGKTLITCGILQALINRGLRTSSFKCGPDYIDPMFHSKVIGTHSRNLDVFFTPEETVRYIMAENCAESDIAVIEGVMGYYDGLGGITTKASAYEVGRATSTPAVLLVNCKGMSASAAALINGYKNFKADGNIQGVILNQTTKSMYLMLKDYIESECDIKVIGYVPKVTDCILESRHLGLVMPDEINQLREKLNRLAGILEESLDLDMLIDLAKNAPALNNLLGVDFDEPISKVKIGVARDEAFSFIYEDNLELLRKMGAEIIEFSPLHNESIPEGINGMIFYGGYPELYAKELSGNTSMIECIGAASKSGMPIMAECGGFMYLHDEMEDSSGTAYKMVGLISGKAFKKSKLSRFGYINLTNVKGSFFNGIDVGVIPAHEFHYYDSTNPGDCFYGQKPVGKRGWDCIHSDENMLAGFPHLYYYGNPKVASGFLEKCRRYERKDEN